MLIVYDVVVNGASRGEEASLWTLKTCEIDGGVLAAEPPQRRGV